MRGGGWQKGEREREGECVCVCVCVCVREREREREQMKEGLYRRKKHPWSETVKPVLYAYSIETATEVKMC